MLQYYNCRLIGSGLSKLFVRYYSRLGSARLSFVNPENWIGRTAFAFTNLHDLSALFVSFEVEGLPFPLTATANTYVPTGTV